MDMTSEPNAKQPAENLDAEQMQEKAGFTATSGRQPSPFTALKLQKAAQGHNTDSVYTREAFHTLQNRTTSAPAARPKR